MSYLFEHEWLLLGVSEGVTWASILLFLICRYRYRLDKLSKWFLLFIILCNLFQAMLVCNDFYFTGKVSFFQVTIILFVIYASTLGGADFKRLDTYIKNKYQKDDRRTFLGSYLDNTISKQKAYTSTHFQQGDNHVWIKSRRMLFFIHTAAFLILHLIWFITSIAIGLPHFSLAFFIELIQYPDHGFFNESAFNIISYAWRTIYFFDFSVFMFYTIQGK